MITGRLFELLYYLMDHQQTTAKQLAQHFEVSVRTIYRDIDRLLVAGIPIITKQGVEGGIGLDQNFVLDKTILDHRQQEQILSALECLSSLHIDEYQKLLNRMQTFFQKETQDRIEVDFSSWSFHQEVNDKFDLLKNAIFHHQSLEFDYINGQGQKGHRYVDPLKLLFKANAWYLQAYDVKKEEYRIYKLSRIGHICLKNAYFDIHRYVDKPQVFRYQENEVKKIDVVLKFQKYLGNFVYDEFEFSDIQEKQDHYLVCANISYHPYLISFLLSFGSGVEVVEPLELKEQIQNELIKMINIYKPDR